MQVRRFLRATAIGTKYNRFSKLLTTITSSCEIEPTRLNILQNHVRQVQKQDVMAMHWQSMQSQLTTGRFSIVSMGKKYMPGKLMHSTEILTQKKQMELIVPVHQIDRKSMMLQKSIMELQSLKENDSKAQLATLNVIAVKCSNLLHRVILDRRLKPGKLLLRPLVLEFSRAQGKLFSELFTHLRNSVSCRALLMELFQEIETVMKKMGIENRNDSEAVHETATSVPKTNTEKPTTSKV